MLEKATKLLNLDLEPKMKQQNLDYWSEKYYISSSKGTRKDASEVLGRIVQSKISAGQIKAIICS